MHWSGKSQRRSYLKTHTNTHTHTHTHTHTTGQILGTQGAHTGYSFHGCKDCDINEKLLMGTEIGLYGNDLRGAHTCIPVL